MAAIVPQKVQEYEHFVNDKLREDLKKVLDERDRIYSQIAEYLQLKTVIQSLLENKINQKDLKTQVDLGCNFYVQAKVPDASRICVCVGYGFYVEFTLPEAIKFIDKKTTHLNSCSEALTKDASKIKAHIKLILEGLREIQQIDTQRQPPRRDIWE